MYPGTSLVVVELQTGPLLLSCPLVPNHSRLGPCVMKQPLYLVFSVGSVDLSSESSFFFLGISSDVGFEVLEVTTCDSVCSDLAAEAVEGLPDA